MGMGDNWIIHKFRLTGCSVGIAYKIGWLKQKWLEWNECNGEMLQPQMRGKNSSLNIDNSKNDNSFQ